MTHDKDVVYFIDHITGHCPVQSEGDVLGYDFYFRARFNSWSLTVYLEDSKYYEERKYGDDDSHGASWMPIEEAAQIIVAALKRFVKLHNYIKNPHQINDEGLGKCRC
jgi:hypothetical protein